MTPWRRTAITYAGRGDPAIAAGAVEAASEHAGMVCRRQRRNGGVLLIEAEQARPWYRIIVEALPQRVTWRLESSGEWLSISTEFRLFPWYSRLLVGLALLVGIALPADLLTVTAPWRTQQPWLDWTLFMLSFPVTLLTLFMIRLFSPLGGGGTTVMIWQGVLAPLEMAGCDLKPQGLTHSGLYLSVMVGYFWFLIVVGASIFIVLPGFSGEVPGVVTFLLALVGLVLFSAIFLNPGRQAFLLRSDPALPGLMNMLAMVVVLILPLPWFVLGLWITSESLGYFYQPVDEYLLRPRGISDEQFQELYREFFDVLQAFGGVEVGLTLLLAVVAIFAALDAVYTSIQTRLWLQRLQSQREDEQDHDQVYRAAVGAVPFLRRFQLAFGAIWLLLSVLILTALGYALVCALQAVVPVFSHPLLDLPRFSAEVIGYLLGRPYGDAWTHGAVRSVWVLYALTATTLLGFSLAQLVRARRSDRQRLLAAKPAASEPRHQAARATLTELARRADVGEVRLAILARQPPYAEARCFGLGGRERFVVVSEGALRDFRDLELQALLAHELAHLRLGHCRKVVWWRWLGRLTFAGDGFVLALQNSFGFEEEADHYVLEHSWAPTSALENCLVTLRHAAAGWHDQGVLAFAPAARARDHGTAQGDDEGEMREDERNVLAGGFLALPLARRWRLAWWLFRRQYLAAMELHYWHPTYQERLNAVRRWRYEHET